MPLRYLIGVVIVTTIAASSVSWAATTANISDAINPHTVHATTISISRALRTRSIDKSSAEERAGAGISVSTSEKLTTLFKSSKVTDEQLQKWLDQGRPAEIVFYRMKLAKSRRWIFSNPQFSKWVQYADKLSDTPSGKGTSAISILAAQFDDERLYSWLKAAKTSQTSEELASRLQNDLLKHWITIGKDPDEVYKLYDLQYASSRLLGDPQFSAWTKYVDDLNAKHEGTKSIISTLRKHYRDAELFNMAEAAKAAKETESMGLKLDDAFVQFWMNDKKTPTLVMAELQLVASSKMLGSPQFSLLVKFTDAYNVKFPQTKMTVIETLTHGLGDEKVTRVLAAVNVND